MEITGSGGGSSELEVGTTLIIGGTNGLFLYDNHGVLGEMAGGGSQTPWTSNIDGGGFGLSNISGLSINMASYNPSYPATLYFDSSYDYGTDTSIMNINAQGGNSYPLLSKLIFNTSVNGTLIPALTLDSAGNVNIGAGTYDGTSALQVNGDVNIGIGGQRTGTWSTNVGSYSTAFGDNASAFGSNSGAYAANSTAIGYAAGAVASDALAIGEGASVNYQYSTVIGNDPHVGGQLNDSYAPGGVTLGGYNPTAGSAENWLSILPVPGGAGAMTSIDSNGSIPVATFNIGNMTSFQTIGQSYGLLVRNHPGDTGIYQNLAQFDAVDGTEAAGFCLSNSNGTGEWYNDFVQIRVHGPSYPYPSSYPSLFSTTNAAGLVSFNVQGPRVTEFVIGSYNGVPTSFYHGGYLDASLGYNGYALSVNPLSNGGENGLWTYGKNTFQGMPTSPSGLSTGDLFVTDAATAIANNYNVVCQV